MKSHSGHHRFLRSDPERGYPGTHEVVACSPFVRKYFLHNFVYLAQVGILFVRCKAGISHSPEEAVEPDDIWAASLALMLFLQEETLK